MILVRLMGGLGNQMFQYATAKAISIRNNSPLKVDLTLLEMGKQMAHEIVTHRDLDLDIFQMKIDFASKSEIEYFNGKVYKSVFGKVLNRLQLYLRKGQLVLENGRGFNSNVTKLAGNVCLVGGWQSEKYFKEFETEIRNDFKFKNPILEISNELLNEIQKNEAVCVNVRRGDYVTSPIYSKEVGALPAEYYNEGMKLITEKIPSAVFYVFSDDLEWCKANLKNENNLVFVEHEQAGKKFSNYLQLMTKCKYFVIPNSTFGWWGAWLSSYDNKIVVAPKMWTIDLTVRPWDIIPEGWIVI
jgi:hypothetical protein